MKITEINRKNLRQINGDIQSALSEVEKKYGIKIKMGNTRYTNKNYTTKIEVAVVQNGEVKSKIATDFERYRHREGIPSKFKVGTRIKTMSGEYFIIEGYKSRAKKYPIVMSNKDGRFKMSVNQLRMSEVVDY